MIQAMENLSDERTEFFIKDRMSFLRFLGLTWADRVAGVRPSGCFARS